MAPVGHEHGQAISCIARTVRRASLAPDIVEAVLDGHEPDAASLRRLRQTMPLFWAEQRQLLGLGRRPSESRDPAVAAT